MNLRRAEIAEMEHRELRFDTRVQMVPFCVTVLRQGASKSETWAVLEQVFQYEKRTAQPH